MAARRVRAHRRGLDGQQRLDGAAVAVVRAPLRFALALVSLALFTAVQWAERKLEGGR